MLTLGFLAWRYLMAAKKKLFSDRKMKEPERKDNEKISANNSNIEEKQGSTATTPLQQAAELLERCQQLLQAANAEAAAHAITEAAAHSITEATAHVTTEAAAHAITEATAHVTTEAAAHAITEAAAHAITEATAHVTTEAAAHPTTEAAAHATTEGAAHATTAARVRRMPTAELRRDPVLWVAYTRGWDDHKVVYCKSTNVGPKPAVTDRPQSSRRPVQPAPTPRPPPMPQSTRLPRLPPQPLMAVLVPRPKSLIPPAPPATRKVDHKSAQRTPAEQTTTAPSQNSWQRRNLSRMREYRGQKKAANPTTSQQYRLQKPAPSTTQPAPGPKSLEATTTPVPEAMSPEVAMPTVQTEATVHPATSIPVDMKISPDEEKELLCDMLDVGPPDDVDIGCSKSPAPTPRCHPDMGR